MNLLDESANAATSSRESAPAFRSAVNRVPQQTRRIDYRAWW